MSPGTRRRAQSEIIRASQHEDFVEAKIWSYQHGTTPLNWQKMKQRMLEEGNDEQELPSSVTGRIGAYTLKEEQQKA